MIGTTGSGNALYAGNGYKYYADASFIAGDSPVTHAINTDLGRNSQDGWIRCDGAGDILVEFSHGATFGDQITLQSGDSMSLTGLNLSNVKVTHSGSDSAYRIFVQ